MMSIFTLRAMRASFQGRTANYENIQQCVAILRATLEIKTFISCYVSIWNLGQTARKRNDYVRNNIVLK